MNIQTLKKEIANAMKEKDIMKVRALRAVLAGAEGLAIEARTKDISEEMVNKSLNREKKVLKEMILYCPMDREDLLAEYEAQLRVINYYAPQLTTDAFEIAAMVEEILDETGLKGNSNKGEIMRVVMPQLKGKVDMKIANEVISKMCK